MPIVNVASKAQYSIHKALCWGNMVKGAPLPFATAILLRQRAFVFYGGSRMVEYIEDLKAETLRTYFNQRNIKSMRCHVCNMHESLCHIHHIMPLEHLASFLKELVDSAINAVERIECDGKHDGVNLEKIFINALLPRQWSYVPLCPNCHIIIHRVIKLSGSTSLYGEWHQKKWLNYVYEVFDDKTCRDVMSDTFIRYSREKQHFADMGNIIYDAYDWESLQEAIDNFHVGLEKAHNGE